MIKKGQKIPNETLVNFVDGEIAKQSIHEILKGKNAVIFALPGAYTPTCSATHLPGYSEKFDELAALGIDFIGCLSVNDAFVMESWKKQLGARQEIVMLCDGNGDFSEKLGMLVNKRDLGFGLRSWRYAMHVRNLIVQKVFCEDKNTPGDPFEVSDAQTMVKYLTTG